MLCIAFVLMYMKKPGFAAYLHNPSRKEMPKESVTHTLKLLVFFQELSNSYTLFHSLSAQPTYDT